jgi:NAD(P)H-dependent FMN reductase
MKSTNKGKQMIKTLIITSTVREGRTSRKVADWYLGQAKKSGTKDMEFEILDIADLNLPLFDQAAPPMMHQYSEIQDKIAEKVGSADAFVFVTAEYNHSIPGSLKNFLDYVNSEWGRKPAVFVGYGTVGGSRAIEHLIQILTELGVTSIGRSGNHIMINSPWSAFDDEGVPKAEFLHGDIPAQLTELSWWASALKSAR